MSSSYRRRSFLLLLLPPQQSRNPWPLGEGRMSKLKEKMHHQISARSSGRRRFDETSRVFVKGSERVIRPGGERGLGEIFFSLSATTATRCWRKRRRDLGDCLKELVCRQQARLRPRTVSFWWGFSWNAPHWHWLVVWSPPSLLSYSEKENPWLLYVEGPLCWRGNKRANPTKVRQLGPRSLRIDGVLASFQCVVDILLVVSDDHLNVSGFDGVNRDIGLMRSSSSESQQIQRFLCQADVLNFSNFHENKIFMAVDRWDIESELLFHAGWGSIQSFETSDLSRPVDPQPLGESPSHKNLHSSVVERCEHRLAATIRTLIDDWNNLE